MLIRNATVDDLDEVSSVQAQCFPVQEAATAEVFSQRLKYYGNHFWLIKKQGRLGVVLRCKDKLVDYYAKFGFINEGHTDKSQHGGAVWNQMRLTFDNSQFLSDGHFIIQDINTDG